MKTNTMCGHYALQENSMRHGLYPVNSFTELRANPGKGKHGRNMYLVVRHTSLLISQSTLVSGDLWGAKMHHSEETTEEYWCAW